MRTVSFQAGDVILSEGEAGDTAYLINSGSVEVIVGKGNKARSVGELGAGEVFGEIGLIDPGPRSATVKALADTECVVTSYDELMVSFQEHPERALEFMKTFARRLRHMNEMVAALVPGKRGLRDVFNNWLDGQTPDRGKVEKMLNMV
jgi:CRP-like cAMP-binding protein